jgi:hypothetical protein
MVKIYTRSDDAPEQRLFEHYLVAIRLYNQNVRTFYHTKFDKAYWIELGIGLDSASTQGHTKDSSQVIRITNLCIAGLCFTPVYCPPITSDTTMTGYDTTDGERVGYYYRRHYNFGRLHIPDACDSIEVKFDAELRDEITDTLIATEPAHLFLSKSQWRISAWLPM